MSIYNLSTIFLLIFPGVLKRKDWRKKIVLGVWDQPSMCLNGHPKICVDTQEHAWTAYGGRPCILMKIIKISHFYAKMSYFLYSLH